MTPIYLDHNATSPLRPEARDAMLALLHGPANPSSVHAFGHRARLAVETARRRVAALVGAAAEEIVFTAGGTEANNLAIHGAVPAGGRARLVTTAIEHPSVLEPLRDLEARGCEVVRVAPASSGVVPAEAILRAAGPGTALVSMMLANNETGALQPVAEVGAELRRRGIPFHCDAIQAAGRLPLDVAALGVDRLTLAAHKLGGPHGVGALYVRAGAAWRPFLRGGGQEAGRRPGTENVAAIAGCGVAAAAAAREAELDAPRIAALRDRLEREILGAFPGASVNAAAAPRLANTSSLAFEGCTGEILVMALDLEGIAVSAGSACSAGSLRRSHVLEAMGLADAAERSIRVSLSARSTAAECAALVAALGRVLARAGAVAAGSRA